MFQLGKNNITGSEISIRKALIGDAEALAVLLSELGYPHSREQVEERVRSTRDSVSDQILVAATTFGIKGFMAIHRIEALPYEKPVARLMALCVNAKERGSGLGALMEREALNIARKWGCGRIELSCSQKRTWAHPFYEKLGYQEYRKFYTKEILEG